MKKLIITCVALLCTISAFSQKTLVGKQKTISQNGVKFSASEQDEIRKILGKDYAAIFENGAMLIVPPQNVSKIKSSPTSRTGFVGFDGPSVADIAGLNKDWWVVTGAGEVALKKKLGDKRFNALKTVLASKDIKF